MANSKKLRRQQRALERLEGRIALDGLGFAESCNKHRNTWSQEREHHTLRKRLGIVGNDRLKPFK